MTPPTSRDDRSAKPEGQVTSYHVIARPQAVAIRIPCDAEHRLLPSGAERERIATSLRSSQ